MFVVCVSYHLVQWIPDYLVTECMDPGCSVQFSTIRHPMRSRRHHCRLCGNIFCDKHCNRRVVLTELNLSVGVRVCNYCFALYVCFCYLKSRIKKHRKVL